MSQSIHQYKRKYQYTTKSVELVCLSWREKKHLEHNVYIKYVSFTHGNTIRFHGTSTYNPMLTFDHELDTAMNVRYEYMFNAHCDPIAPFSIFSPLKGRHLHMRGSIDLVREIGLLFFRGVGGGDIFMFIHHTLLIMEQLITGGKLERQGVGVVQSPMVDVNM